MTIPTGVAVRTRGAALRALAILRSALQLFLSIDGSQRAGAFAHFAFFSFFPAIILLVAAASLFVDRQRAADEIIAFIKDYVAIGPRHEGFVFQTIKGVVAARGNASVVAVLLLCWGAMRFLATLIRAINRAWGAEIRTWWRLSLHSLVLLLIVVVAVPLGVLATVWLKQAQPSWMSEGGAIGAVRMVVGAVVPLAMLFVALMILFRFAPRRRTRLGEVWAAALCTTALLAAAEWLFKFYLLHVATLNAVYGALGGIMALLLWIYLSGAIIIFGACLCAARSQCSGQQAT